MYVVDEKEYSRKDLEVYLESLGLPHSHPTIIRLEKEGKIPSPRRKHGKSLYRKYTGKQLKEIAALMRDDIYEKI